MLYSRGLAFAMELDARVWAACRAAAYVPCVAPPALLPALTRRQRCCICITCSCARCSPRATPCARHSRRSSRTPLSAGLAACAAERPRVPHGSYAEAVVNVLTELVRAEGSDARATPYVVFYLPAHACADTPPMIAILREVVEPERGEHNNRCAAEAAREQGAVGAVYKSAADDGRPCARGRRACRIACGRHRRRCCRAAVRGLL
jgi:hypothetical protein